MSNPNLLIFAPREEPQDILDTLRGAGLELSFGEKAWQAPRTDFESDLAAAARDKVALMGTSIRHTPITRRVMEEAQRLRVIAKYTVGVDDIDTDAATDLGIMVCHAPTESNCFGVAESTMAMILAMLKRIVQRDREVREGKWREPHMATTFLGARADGYAGVTIGLVGLGRIATRVAQLLAPWRVRVIAYDPYAEPARFLLANVERVNYETLLRQSDVVSFHVVLTKETRFMLRAEQIAMMKPNAVVINTARGKVIDEAAVAAAIAEGRLRGAAIDAFEEEPLAMDSPLRQFGDRVLLSPHSASFNEGGELRPGIQWAVRAVLTALRGGIPDNVYNKDVLPRWRERFGGAGVIAG
ncbi:MAG: Glyoxylate reductase/D-3-phosphoglycerate dehydrogenase [Hyphomicrobiales bacterium]|nr:Glyoxylate reductase/D-3-phosphoglycerate dehydrogenase [Hyphomicrobiales bacterium]